MNIQTVGTENLPNIFIEEIFIYSSGDSLLNKHSQRVVVRLCMYDHHPNRSWRRPDMSDLQVKIVFISGLVSETSEKIGKLNNGESSLYDYKTTSLNTLGHGTHVITLGTQDFVPAGGEGGYRKFKKTVEITIDQPENLNVYAACFIGDLNLGSDVLNKFYGPMSAEKIYVGDELNRESSYFYYTSTNEEYGGPAHVHDGTWMEGSRHTTNAHENLSRVMEENYKIKAISGIVDPNDFLPDEPGPQSGAGNAWEKEALAGIVEDLAGDLVNSNPHEEIDENPDNSAGSNFDPDEPGGY